MVSTKHSVDSTSKFSCIRAQALTQGQQLYRHRGFSIYLFENFLTESFYQDCLTICHQLPYKRKLAPQYRVWTLEGHADTTFDEKVRGAFACPDFLSLMNLIKRSSERLQLRCYEWLRLDCGDYLQPHSDSTQKRQLQAVLYLNPSWTREDGGLLEIMDKKTGNLLTEPLLPKANRLVVFTADKHHLHRVTPVNTKKNRYSLSISYA